MSTFSDWTTGCFHAFRASNRAPPKSHSRSPLPLPPPHRPPKCWRRWWWSAATTSIGLSADRWAMGGCVGLWGLHRVPVKPYATPRSSGSIPCLCRLHRWLPCQNASNVPSRSHGWIAQSTASTVVHSSARNTNRSPFQTCTKLGPYLFCMYH